MSDTLKSLYESNPKDRPRKTQTYSFIDPQRMGVRKMEIKDVISDFIETNIMAWKSLPQPVRNLIVKSPDKFKFIYKEDVQEPPAITFCGVTFFYNSSHKWELQMIED